MRLRTVFRATTVDCARLQILTRVRHAVCTVCFENVPLGFRPAPMQAAGPREAVQARCERASDTRRDKSPGDWLGRAPLSRDTSISRSIPEERAQLPGKSAYILLQEIARLEKNNASQQPNRASDLGRRSRDGCSLWWSRGRSGRDRALLRRRRCVRSP